MQIKVLSKRRILFTILSIAATAFIFSQSLQPAIESDELSTGLLENILALLSSWEISGLFEWLNSHSIRKLAHFIEFFVQGTFLHSAYYSSEKPKSRFLLSVLLSGFLTACTDETIQRFIPGRSGQISDVLLDTSGTIGAIALCSLLLYWHRKRK